MLGARSIRNGYAQFARYRVTIRDLKMAMKENDYTNQVHPLIRDQLKFDDSERSSSQKVEFKQDHLYPRDGNYVSSNAEPVKGYNRPIPLNVELTHYSPIKHAKTHGHKVADIQLRSYTKQNLDFYSDFLLRVAFYLKIPAVGPTPLPNKTEKWTVIKSPFAMAKTKENFQRITHGRIIKLYDANADVVQMLLAAAHKYSIAGVGIRAHIYNKESLSLIENMDTPPVKIAQEGAFSLAMNPSRADVAKAVMEILEDPTFKNLMKKASTEQATEESAAATEEVASKVEA
jgi:small subunit ribosomal protein S10